MKHAASREVFNYWNYRRGDRAAPERGDIDPVAIRRSLSDTFILAYEPETRHPFRLAGTRICALLGRELKGESFAALWDEADRARIDELVAIVAEESTGMIAAVTGTAEDGQKVDLEMLLLPLTHRIERRGRMIGVLAPLATPYWIGTMPIVALALGPVRHVGGEADTVAPRLVAGERNALGRAFVVHQGGRQ